MTTDTFSNYIVPSSGGFVYAGSGNLSGSTFTVVSLFSTNTSITLNGTATSTASSFTYYIGATPFTVTSPGDAAGFIAVAISPGNYYFAANHPFTFGQTVTLSTAFGHFFSAPSAPVATLSPASDSGVVGDYITNITTPSLTGTGTAGDTISLFDGSGITPVGTVIVSSSGSWSVQPTAALSPGLHSLTVTETSGGGTSAASAAVTLTIDTSVPATATGVALAPSSDTGALGDGLTSATTPSITGTGVAGDTIALYDGTNPTPIATATVGSNGTWTVVPSTALANGVHNLTVKQSNPAGTASAASASLALTIDTSVPVATSAPALAPSSDTGALGDGLTSATTPSITGTGVAGDTIALYDGTNPTPIGTATVGSNGTWTVVPSTALANGAHSLTVKQSNPAGTASAASASLALTIDTSVPVATSAPALAPSSDTGALGDGLTSATTPSITGTGVAGDTIALYDGTNPTPIATAAVGSNGTWTVVPSTVLANGAHSLTVKQSNPAGTASAASASLALTIDTSVPAAATGVALAPSSDTGALGDGLTSATTPSITGTGVAGDTIKLYDGTNPTPIATATVGSNGTWTVVPSTALANGVHSLTVKQSNPAGTASAASASLALTIDTSVPAAATGVALAPSSDTGALGDGLTSATTPSITGTGVAGDTIKLYDGTNPTPIATATVGSNGTWTVVPSTALANGAHSLTVKQSNPAGTASAASASLALTIDTSVPATVTGVALTPSSDTGALGDGLTSATTPSITGTGVAGDTIALYDGTNPTPIATAAVGSNGTWTVVPSTVLANGAHSLTVKQSNPAGTASAASASLALTIDTSVPASPTLAETTVSSSPAEPILTGLADNGSTVLVYDGTTLIGTTVAGASGYTLALQAALSPGAHTLVARERTAAGTLSQPASLAVQVSQDQSYQVVVPAGSGQSAYSYDPTGALTQIVTSDAQGLVNQTVTNTAAVLNIYDSSGVLIGTVGQSVGSIFVQPPFSTARQSQGALTGTSSAGSVINLLKEGNAVTSTGPDTINAGSGSTQITAQGATALVSGQAASLTFNGGAGTYTVLGGTGSSSINGGAGGGLYQGGSAGHNLIASGSGAATLFAGGAGDTLVGGGGRDLIVGSAGPVTIAGGTSGSVIVGSTATSLIATRGGNNVVLSRGADTIVGSTGTDLVGATGNTQVFGGSGQLTFINGAGTSTVVGGTGSGTLFGGAGGGFLAAGSAGNSILVGGAQQTTLLGGGSGDQLFASGSQQTVLMAGAGAETLIGASSSANNVFFAGAGPTLIYAGAGNDAIVAGTGSATLVGGGGSNLYGFTNGRAGGSALILDFNTKLDHLTLSGFAAGESDRALQTASVSEGSTNLTLSDGTQITLAGVASLGKGNFV